MQLGHLHISTYNSGEVFFPFSIAYGWVYSPTFGSFPRFAAGFREAGIAQAFFVWAILSAQHFDIRARKIVLAGLLLGLFETFSTMAFFVLGICLALQWFFTAQGSLARRVGVLVFGSVLVGVCAYIAIFSEGFGVQSKQDGESMGDRTASMQKGFERLLENPLFGARATERGNAINLVGELGSTGLVGFLCFLVSTRSPWRRRSEKRRRRALCSPSCSPRC